LIKLNSSNKYKLKNIKRKRKNREKKTRKILWSALWPGSLVLDPVASEHTLLKETKPKEIRRSNPRSAII